ncbi:MAG TPA: hypothetical protein DDY43_14850 [Synechococcales bacterium UBA10510]|nr:hypothetical protein [Synechococcales bacterium UBA10510]
MNWLNERPLCDSAGKASGGRETPAKLNVLCSTDQRALSLGLATVIYVLAKWVDGGFRGGALLLANIQLPSSRSR